MVILFDRSFKQRHSYRYYDDGGDISFTFSHDIFIKVLFHRNFQQRCFFTCKKLRCSVLSEEVSILECNESGMVCL